MKELTENYEGPTENIARAHKTRSRYALSAKHFCLLRENTIWSVPQLKYS